MLTAQDYHITIATPVSPEEAYERICHVPQWWVTTMEGGSNEVGDAFTVRFGDTYVDFKIEEAIPGRRLVWQVTNCYLSWLADKTEWNGTTVIWEISSTDTGSKVAMTHIGVAPGVECYEDCRKGWDFYVGESLLKLIIEGKGQPEGYNEP